MADCNHDCSSCSVGDCAERKIEKLKPNQNTTIKHLYKVDQQNQRSLDLSK